MEVAANYIFPEFWGLKAVKRDSGLASEIDLERLMC